MSWSRWVQLAALCGALVSAWLAFTQPDIDVELTLDAAPGIWLYCAFAAAPFIAAARLDLTGFNNTGQSDTRSALLLVAIALSVVTASLVYPNEPSPNGSDGLKPIGVMVYQAMIIGIATMLAAMTDWVRAR